MTYDKRFKNEPKGPDDGTYLDTGNPYQNLANAIVIQAGEDLRKSLTFLSGHRRPPRIEDYVTAEQLAALTAQVRRTKDERHFLSRIRSPYYREEAWNVDWAVWWRIEQMKRARDTAGYRRYVRDEERWVEASGLRRECEEFFRSDWAAVLTKADVLHIMTMIKIEVILNTMDQRDIALRIEREIYAQGRTIASVLEEAGLNRNMMQGIRNGENGPSARTIEALCRVLGKDPNWLLGWEDA